MKFYEVRFLCEPGVDAGEVDTRARGVAERVATPMKVFGVTIHGRSSQAAQSRYDAAVILAVEAPGDEHDFDEFAGRMARTHGLPMSYKRKFGQNTLSLKSDMDAIEDFIENSKGNEGDSDPDFSIDGPEDSADEGGDGDFDIDL